jgi:AraC family transcriptional regulator of adaptative response / DNA-3-methyladenine glycosylase II
MEAGSRLAKAAATTLRTDLESETDLEELAGELGVTGRHLRRVFQEEFGVAPIQYAQTQRLLMAKQLLADTHLPMTEVALASGFKSLRRFNSSIKERYRLSPTEMRSQRAEVPEAPVLKLAYRPPLAWDHLLGFLGARAIPGVEKVEGGSYYRALRIRQFTGTVRVGLSAREGYLEVAVSPTLMPVLAAVLEKVRRLFDLGADPAAIAGGLGELAKSLPGVRVPGCVDEFELAVRAVLGQQVSVKGARTLAGRLITAFGTPVLEEVPGLTHVFPLAADLARESPEELRSIGLTGARAATLSALARAMDSGELRLRPGVPIHESLRSLVRVPGIGEWTAQYIGMRALAWPDAFPHGDLVLRKALGGVTPKRCLELAEPWRPWRAYAAMCLWNSMGAVP